MIDAHVHFWDPALLHYDWLSNLPGLQRAFLPDDLLAAAAGCDLQRAVLVQADCACDQGVGEVEWVKSLAETHAWIAGIVAFVPLERGEVVVGDLERWKRDTHVKGIRRLIQSEAPGFCKQASFVSMVRRLPEFGYPFDLCVKHQQLDEVIELVDACPETSFILDHIAKPAIAEGLMEPWRKQITELARRPNVVCKLSGVVTEAAHDSWTRETLAPYIDVVTDAFGVARLLFGSDWPVCTVAGGYRAWWDALQASLGSLSAPERAALFGENAVKVYGLAP